MVDARAKKLAELVLDYSIKIREGDRLLLQVDPCYWEYGKLLADGALKRGAELKEDLLSFDTHFKRELFQKNDSKEWEAERDRRIELSAWCNTRICLNNDSDPHFLEGIQNKDNLLNKFNLEVMKPYRDVLYRPGNYFGYEVRWNIVGFPSREDASMARMDYSSYKDFVYGATVGVDWKEMAEKMESIKQFFDNGKEVRVNVPGQTDITMSIEGRQGEVCAGLMNMPDGEVFYAPVENSVNGYIYFQHPALFPGQGFFEGIRLLIEDGKVTDFDVNGGKERKNALEKILDTDEGSRTFGELGLGCNYGIKKPIGEVLFDEKIGGTIHLALGEAVSKDKTSGGGDNDSAIHWDIVCDLRPDEKNPGGFPGGIIEVDGKVVQEKGKWLI